ncbi:MAG: hypothetical protein HGA80_04110 [Candidatus Omnitrophica bacterium]|nr:hypothetical protein [Candidatus Omnitrophota bacterium]
MENLPVAKISFRTLGLVASLFSLTFLFSTSPVSAATLDDFYGPLMPSGKMLYKSEADVYAMQERGIHGSASFSGFVSEPQTYSVRNGLTVPLWSGSELSVGLQNELPARYDRATKNNAGVVSSYQRYHLDLGQQLDLAGRYRRGSDEFTLGVFMKRGESDWLYGPTRESQPSIINYFDSAYEEAGVSWRHLSEADSGDTAASPAFFDRPLLDSRQLNIEGGLTVCNGRVTRHRQYYHPTASQAQQYLFRTETHAFPKVTVRYGITPDVEAGIGFGFKTPFKYKYYYELYNQSGTRQFISGTYSYDRWLELPLTLRIRPAERWEWLGAAEFRHVSQKLDAWQRSTSGTLTDYPQKKLDLYQMRPSLSLQYQGGPVGQGTPPDTLLPDKRMLGKGQSLSRLEWCKDISISRGNVVNGAQNLADPYDLYRYPLEFFREGTEYSALLSGNNGTTPAQVSPQNYHEFRAGLDYGFADTLNMGILVGYRTSAHTHQFSLSDLAQRQYIFRPFYYLDWNADWRVGKSVLLFSNVHFVPDYKTSMTSSLASTPEEFKDHTRYVVATAGVRILF